MIVSVTNRMCEFIIYKLVHCCDSCEKSDGVSFVRFLPVSFNTDMKKIGLVLLLCQNIECVRKTSNKVCTESIAANRRQALARIQKNILKHRQNFFHVGFLCCFRRKAHN